MVTIAREGLEDKYGLQLNPGEGQEGNGNGLDGTLGRGESRVSRRISFLDQLSEGGGASQSEGGADKGRGQEPALWGRGGE